MTGAAMGPVERAIRAKFKPPATLCTLAQRKPFQISVIDSRGIVLLLGIQESPVRLSWECLESIPAFLRSQPGWVPAGGAHSVEGDTGTVDEFLKGWVKTDVARWLACVLRDAGIVEVIDGPLRLRLTKARIW
jgi:hypothetical protein